MLADNSIRFLPVKVQKIRYYVTNFSIICHKSTNYQRILSAQHQKSHQFSLMAHRFEI